MVTLSSCLIWQIMRFILPPNEYGCVYALLSGPAIDLQKMSILAKKNHLFRWSSFWFCRVCQQAKMSYLLHRKPTYIEKPTQPKRVTVWYEFWSTSIIGPFFSENQQGKAVTVNGDHYLGHRKPKRIHWNVVVPKTGHSLVRILVQRYNCAIFLRKWARRGRYSQWRSLSGHIEQFERRILVASDNWRFKGQYSWSHLWNRLGLVGSVLAY